MCMIPLPTTTGLPPAWIQPPKLKRSVLTHPRHHQKVNRKVYSCCKFVALSAGRIFGFFSPHPMKIWVFARSGWLSDKKVSVQSLLRPEGDFFFFFFRCVRQEQMQKYLNSVDSVVWHFCKLSLCESYVWAVDDMKMWTRIISKSGKLKEGFKVSWNIKRKVVKVRCCMWNKVLHVVFAFWLHLLFAADQMIGSCRKVFKTGNQSI